MRDKLLANRIESFKQAKSINQDVKSEAVLSGFYYEKDRKEIACLACGLKLTTNCLKVGKISELHTSFGSDCAFMNWRESSLDILYLDGENV